VQVILPLDAPFVSRSNSARDGKSEAGLEAVDNGRLTTEMSFFFGRTFQQGQRMPGRCCTMASACFSGRI
jgi:hypothetical protein